MPAAKDSLCLTCIEGREHCQYNTRRPVRNCHDYSPVFHARVKRELEDLREKQPDVCSHREGYTLLLEGIEKYWEWIKLDKEVRDNTSWDMRQSLARLGAMIQKVAEDTGLNHCGYDD